MWRGNLSMSPPRRLERSAPSPSSAVSDVRAGDPLFALDDVPEKAARDQAARTTGPGPRQLDDLKKGSALPKSQSAQAQLDQAQAALALAEQELARQEKLAGVPGGAARRTSTAPVPPATRTAGASPSSRPICKPPKPAPAKTKSRPPTPPSAPSRRRWPEPIGTCRKRARPRPRRTCI